ncbi:MAG: gamma-glutamyltransferase, partial [Kiloniellales bacterium]|nr:gamma-glutamyltransferase [Kiloniellales bacterium]
NPYSAGFIAADQWANTVACSFSMNGLFGEGRMVPESGIIAAGPYSSGSVNLTPVVVGNEKTGDLRFAASASGGLAAPAALIQSMLRAYGDEEGGLNAAISAPRVTHVGRPDITWVESAVPQNVRSALLAKGHNVKETAVIGSVVALYCEDGALQGNETCEIVADKRAFGLGLRVQ